MTHTNIFKAILSKKYIFKEMLIFFIIKTAEFNAERCVE